MIWSRRGLDEVWNPFREAQRAHHTVERILSELRPTRVTRGTPPTNVYLDGDAVVIRAELPGFGPEDVQIEVEDLVLTLKGEATPGLLPVAQGEEGEEVRTTKRSFHRRFRLPFRVQADEVEAQVQHGILSLRLPRAAEDRPRKIPVRG